MEDDEGKNPHAPERSHRRELKLAYFIAFITAIAAIGAAASAYYAGQTLERSQRAWIVPRGAEIVPDEKILRVAVQYENAGNEPALNTWHQWQPRIVKTPVNVFKVVYFENRWPSNLACKIPLSNTQKWTVYPSPNNINELVLNTETGGRGIRPTLRNGEDIFVLEGCFIYETFGVTRHSSYCLYLEPVQGETLNPSWQFKFCPGGNDDTN